VISDNGDLSDPWEVRVKDVSRHGVGFESSQRMDVGTLCRIRIGRGPLELARRVRIIRSYASDDSGHTFTIGAEFV
jgi:hypothetical protein